MIDCVHFFAIILTNESKFMNVFLRYSPRDERDMALGIYSTILKLGHTHTSDFVEKLNPDTFYIDDESEWASRYKKSLEQMDLADICIFESSIPSTAMGQLAQLSVDKFKPTILLYRKGKKPYFFRGMAEVEKRVQLLEYKIGRASCRERVSSPV